MYNYDSIKHNHGKRVSQTIDSPILVLDYFELSDVFISLFIVLLFGVVFYAWGTMTFLLLLALGVGPVIKKRNHRGIFLHWPYRIFVMSLPGLVNPRGRKKYSD